MDFLKICSDDVQDPTGGNSTEVLLVEDQSSNSQLLSDVLLAINKYVIPIVGIMGFVFNLCGVATIVHMGVTTSSMVYMLVLAVGDLVSGFVDSIVVVGLPNFGYDVHVVGRWTCKVAKWLNYATTFSTQFVLVLFTFDRVLAVTFPLKYRLLKNNLKYPVIACSVTIPLIYLLTAGNLYVFDLEDGECKQAWYISEIGGKIYFHYTATLLYCAIPSALLFVFNVIIIIQMRKRGSNSEKKSRESAITRVLLVVSGAFLVFTTLSIIPLYVALFYMQPRMHTHAWAECWFSVLLQVNELPAVANVSFNFLFYMMGSKIFRDGFKSMMKSKLNLCAQQ